MDPDGATRVVLRPLATPLPLGFLGLVVAASMSACRSSSELSSAPSMTMNALI